MNALCQIHQMPLRETGMLAMSTEDLLVEWGLWLNSVESPVKGYVSPALVVSRRGSTRLRSLPECTIDDDTAVVIDQAVARLTDINQEMGKGLVMYFCWRWSYREIGNRWGINKNQVQQVIKQAVAWMDGRLDHHRASK